MSSSRQLSLPVEVSGNRTFFLDVFSSLLRFMFEGLQKKWKVSGPRLALILCTFAIGGSLTGFVGKKIMNVLSIQQDWLWAVVYILLITLLWPVSVLIVSIPFGQFGFFSKYIRKIGVKMGIGGKVNSR